MVLFVCLDESRQNKGENEYQTYEGSVTGHSWRPPHVTVISASILPQGFKRIQRGSCYKSHSVLKGVLRYL